MKLLVIAALLSISSLFAQQPVLLDSLLVDVNDTPALLQKDEMSPKNLTLNFTVEKNICTDWQTRRVRTTRQEYRCNGRIGGTYPRGGRTHPRGGRTYPRGNRYPRGGRNNPGSMNNCRYVTVPYTYTENYCVSSYVEFVKQPIKLNFIRLNKGAMITMSVRENVNGVQSIDTSVNATSSRCLKATKYSKNSMGDISSVTISVKKKRSCRGL